MDKNIKNSAPNNAYGINDAKEGKQQFTNAPERPSANNARTSASRKQFRDTALRDVQDDDGETEE